MPSPLTGKKQKARSTWTPMDLWDVERRKNLAVERKKEKILQKKQIPRRISTATATTPTSNTVNGTSTAREKRRKRIESSVSGKKLNIYLDSTEAMTHIDEMTTESVQPPTFRVLGLPLVHFVPILIAIKESVRKGLFTKTRSISGTNTDQYFLKNQDTSMPMGEAVIKDWRKSNLLDRGTVCAIDSLAWSILEAIPAVKKPEDWSVDVGFLCNRKEEGEVHQTLHLDVPEAENFPEKNLLPYIVHIPLCMEGMALQIVCDDGNENPPNFRYYGFGEASILRGDCWHGGCYGGKGNVRMRIQLSHKDFPDDRGIEKLKHKITDLPDKTVWPVPSAILKLAQTSDLKKYRCLQTNWYRNRMVSIMKGPEFLSLDLLSNVR